MIPSVEFFNSQALQKAIARCTNTGLYRDGLYCSHAGKTMMIIQTIFQASIGVSKHCQLARSRYTKVFLEHVYFWHHVITFYVFLDHVQIDVGEKIGGVAAGAA